MDAAAPAAPARGGAVVAAIQRLLGRRPPTWLLVAVAAAATLVAAVGVAAAVDGAALTDAARAAADDPVGILVVAAALLGAFSLRAVAWRRLLPGLGFGQALAAVHLALGANHVLPFRLGEGARVASVVRRTSVRIGPATASAVVLRLADVLTLAAVGIVAAPAVFGDLLGPWGAGLTGAVAVAAAAAWVWVARLARRGDGVTPPDAPALVLTAAAWLLEGVAVWQALRWSGIDVSARGALLVTAAAVTAQVAAIAPSGFGTYEAAATAALVALGASPGPALAAALVVHAAKTAYSLLAGGLALVAPRPSFLRARTARGPAPVEPAPVVSVEGGAVSGP